MKCNYKTHMKIIIMCHSLINTNWIVGKLLWYKRNSRMLQDNQLWVETGFFFCARIEISGNFLHPISMAVPIWTRGPVISGPEAVRSGILLLVILRQWLQNLTHWIPCDKLQLYFVLRVRKVFHLTTHNNDKRKQMSYWPPEEYPCAYTALPAIQIIPKTLARR